jgi:hypothetical protein
MFPTYCGRCERMNVRPLPAKAREAIMDAIVAQDLKVSQERVSCRYSGTVEEPVEQ